MPKRDEIVGFNSSRPLAWIKDKILQKLEVKVSDPTKLHNLIVMAESGSAWIRYDTEGQRHDSIDKFLVLPEDLHHPQDPTRTIRDDIKAVFENMPEQ